MYHHTIELQAIVRAHQDDLLDTSARYRRGRISPSLLSRCRRGIGLGMIAAGERLADRRDRRPTTTPATETIGARRVAL